MINLRFPNKSKLLIQIFVFNNKMSQTSSVLNLIFTLTNPNTTLRLTTFTTLKLKFDLCLVLILI